MPDEPVSAAPSAVEPAEPEIPPMESWTDDQLTKWRMDGETPEPLPVKAVEPPKAEEPAPKAVEPAPQENKEPSETPPPTSEEAVKTAAASEPAQTQEPKKPEGEKRKGQLASDIQGLLKQRSELRRENERILAERATPPVEVPAEPIAAPTRPKFPQAEDSETDEAYQLKLVEYETKLDEYFEATAKAVVAEDRSQREIEAHNQSVQRQEHATAINWNQKETAYQQAHPEVEDYRETADTALEAIPDGSLIDKWVLQSDLGPDLLVHFGKKPEEIGKILSLHPFNASRELTKLELSLSSNGIKKEAPAPAKITAAPRPARTLPGTATPPADQIEAAIGRGDAGTGDYIKLANARDALTQRT